MILAFGDHAAGVRTFSRHFLSCYKYPIPFPVIISRLSPIDILPFFDNLNSINTQGNPFPIY